MRQWFGSALKAAIGVLVLGLITVPDARSQTLDCVSHVHGAHRAVTGIATERSERTVLIQSCDGNWFALAGLNGDQPVFTAHAGPLITRTGRHTSPLPDGDLTGSVGQIERAWLGDPTSEYRHGILGDTLEAKSLHVRLGGGQQLSLTVGEGYVYEDRRIRLASIDQDERPELIVIRAGRSEGASLDIYRVNENTIEEYVRTPPIGRANRWLNPAGLADFDGDGEREIAFVETPHIGGTLRVFGFNGTTFRQEASARGFSNHLIGARELDLAAVVDWNRDGKPDLAVPDNPRRTLRIMSLQSGALTEIARIENSLEIVTGIFTYTPDGGASQALAYALSDGTFVVNRRP